MNITKITATEIYKRNGKFKGFRYDAHFADGHVEVARACATRLYDFAFQYSYKANYSGKSGLAPYFCFGKRDARDNAIATFPIQVEHVAAG